MLAISTYRPVNQKSACIAACKGYKYAGTELGYLCFCGNVLPAAELKRPGECTTVCSGNQSEMCGGDERINIYDVPGKFTVLLLQDLNTFTNFALV